MVTPGVPFDDDVGEAQLLEVVLPVILHALLVAAAHLGQLLFHGVEAGQIDPLGGGNGIIDAVELVVGVANLLACFL